jgi:hypothetical protein
LAALGREVNRATALNISAPDPISHPNDLIIGPRSGTITIAGLLTAQEKPKWDRVCAFITELRESAAELRREAAETDNDETVSACWIWRARRKRLATKLLHALSD